MKKDRCRKIWMVGLLCGAIVFGLACQTGLAGDVVRIAAGEWAPYLGPDLPHSGIAGRIIKDAFSKSHIKVEFKFYPWKRAFQLAEKGAFDGTAIWFKNSEREKSFYYSDAVIVEKFVIFHLKAQPFTWRTFEDLHGKILGGLLGFSYGEEMDRAIRSKIVNMERTSSDVQNFKKLLIGRIHLYPQEVKVGCQVLET